MRVLTPILLLLVFGCYGCEEPLVPPTAYSLLDSTASRQQAGQPWRTHTLAQ